MGWAVPFGCVVGEQDEFDGVSGSDSESVLWGEMDAFQHVNNTVYFRYFEMRESPILEPSAIWLDAGAWFWTFGLDQLSFSPTMTWPMTFKSVRAYLKWGMTVLSWSMPFTAPLKNCCSPGSRRRGSL